MRLVREQRSEHPSLRAAVESIAPMIGCTSQTLLGWVNQEQGTFKPSRYALRVSFHRLQPEFRADIVGEVGRDLVGADEYRGITRKASVLLHKLVEPGCDRLAPGSWVL